MTRKVFDILANKMSPMVNIPQKCCKIVFARDDIRYAVFQLKLGKAAGLDHLTAECIKKLLYSQLAFPVKLCCKYGFVPKNFAEVE